MASSNTRFPRLLTAALALALALLAAVPGRTEDKKPTADTVRPVAKKDVRWQNLHNSFLERAKQGPVGVLFLGDSITEAWSGSGKGVWNERYEPLHAANFGIGGDKTQHVLWRLQEGKELEGIHPKAVVLMIGTNNMGSDRARQIAEGIGAIVHELHHQLPQAHILLLGIFPRQEMANHLLRDKVEYVNHMIAKLDDGKHVHYLDIGGKFLEPDGRLSKDIMPDFLHLSAKGYTIWAEAIQPSLDKLLKE